MSTVQVTKRYRLRYCMNGSATYETVTSEEGGTSELLTIHSDGSMSRYVVVGVCMPCVDATARGLPRCDWPECSGRDVGWSWILRYLWQRRYRLPSSQMMITFPNP
jgi:hypothetical protein